MGKTDSGICKTFAALPLLFSVHAIYCSSSHLLLITLTIATAILFLLSKGNPGIPYILIAIGPIIGLSVVFKDSYIYNSELILFIFSGCLWMKNDLQNTFIHLKKDPIFLILFMLLMAVVFLSTFHIIYLKTEITSEIRLARLFFTALFMLFFVKRASEKDIMLFYKTTVLASLFIAVIGIIQFSVNALMYSSYAEPKSIFSSSETLAIYLCVTTAFITACKSKPSTALWSAAAFLSVFLMILLLFFTRSRTAIASISIFILIYGTMCLKRKNSFKIIGLITIIVFLLTALAVFFFKTFSHSMLFSDNFLSFLFSSRIQAWSEGIELINRSPLWGNGPVNNVYNQYLQIICQYGITGFAVSALLICVLLLRFIKKCNTDNLFIHCGFWPLIVLSITGIGETVLGNQLSYYIFFIILISETIVPTSRGVASSHTPESFL